jgi:hypothetical protein
LLFGAETFVFQFTTQKDIDENIQNYNFACWFVRVWNVVAHMREERRLKVLENRVLRRISEPKRDEVTGEWRKLHNEELNDVYCSPSTVGEIKSRKMRWAGHVARMGDKTYMILVGKPEGKRPLGRPRCRWEDSIKIDFQEVGCRGMEWIELAQDKDRWRALINAVMNLRVS